MAQRRCDVFTFNNIVAHTVVMGGAVNAGDALLIGLVASGTTGTISSVTVSGGESAATEIGSVYTSPAISGHVNRIMFYLLGSVANAGTKTITINKSTYFNVMGFVCALDAAYEPDADNTASGTAAAFAVGLTAAANAAVFQIVFAGFSSGKPNASGTGYAALVDSDDGTSTISNAAVYANSQANFNIGAGGSITPTMTPPGASDAFATRAVSIKPAGGGGGGSTLVLPMLLNH